MWNKIFNVQNPFWQSMDTMFDLFVINLLFVLCCLPIVTIGPAITALYYALIQKILGEEGYLKNDFFKSFKQNLKQGMLLGIPLTLCGAFLAFDVYLCHAMGKGIFTFFMVFFAVLFLLWMFISIYAYALLAKFDRKNRDILVWAFTLSIKHAPMTIIMILVMAGGIFITVNLPGLLFIIFGLLGQFCSTIISSIIKPYLPTNDDGFAEDDFYNFNPGTSNNQSKDYMDYDNIQDLF
ncbi:MAG: YesL family protein [Lachnospiraceae bacterium]|nr:YesL family protein [Lachnospiraceae bacterium]